MQNLDFSVELASRVNIEQHGCDYTDQNIRQYRCDTRSIFGDYTIIDLPVQLANESAVRIMLYEVLKAREIRAKVA